MKRIAENDVNVIQSLSYLPKSVRTNPCPVCSEENNLVAIVNYLDEPSVEYFSFILCCNCTFESDGGGIFYDYQTAVKNAQEFWNSIEPEKPNESENPNQSQ